MPGLMGEGPVLLHFSFPRAGGHYLTHSIRALYDTEPESVKQAGGIIWPEQAPSATRGDYLRGDAEARDRDNEINPLARYSLTLRSQAGALCPVKLVHGRTGMHGLPGGVREGEYAVIIIRDPIATIYSLYRVWRDRWEPGVPFDTDSIRHYFGEYSRFYDAAYALKAENHYHVKIVRYENLVASSEELRQFCNFLGVQTKLEPEFVWHVTKFENFTTQQVRSFYREGKNDAWKSDSAFCALLAELENFDFRGFGYGSLNEYLASVPSAADSWSVSVDAIK